MSFVAPFVKTFVRRIWHDKQLAQDTALDSATGMQRLDDELDRINTYLASFTAQDRLSFVGVSRLVVFGHSYNTYSFMDRSASSATLANMSGSGGWVRMLANVLGMAPRLVERMIPSATGALDTAVVAHVVEDDAVVERADYFPHQALVAGRQLTLSSPSLVSWVTFASLTNASSGDPGVNGVPATVLDHAGLVFGNFQSTGGVYRDATNTIQP